MQQSGTNNGENTCKIKLDRVLQIGQFVATRKIAAQSAIRKHSSINPLGMDELRQAAYRNLLYVAMLDIRNYCQSRGAVSWNPAAWYRQYHNSRIAGAIADWLHNLANYSSKLYGGFSEETFWKEHEHLCKKYPRAELERYRRIFEEHLAGKKWP